MSYKQYTIRRQSDQTTHQWANRNLDGEMELCKRRVLATLFQRYLPKRGPILEAGCGLGGWVQHLSDAGYEVIGIDWYEAVVQVAKAAHPSLPLEVGDIRALRFADGELAAYISLGVIEHFENGPDNALREAYRVLRAGGVIIITVPALTPIRRLLVHPLRTVTIRLLALRGRPTYFAEYRYSVEELRGFVESAGFQVLAEEVDDVVESELAYHMGLFVDFPILRSKTSMKLNGLGRIVYRIARLVPGRWFASGYFIAAVKPHPAIP